MENQRGHAHVLVVTYPAQGHINPLVQLAKRLTSKGVKTTLATTPYTVDSIRVNSAIAVEPISDGFDEGGFNQAPTLEAYLESFKTAGSKTLAELIMKFNNSATPVCCVVYDALLYWALGVAKEFGIPAAIMLTNSVTVCSFYWQINRGRLPLLVQQETLAAPMPGVPSLDVSDLPSFLAQPTNQSAYLSLILDKLGTFDENDWVFCNSFEELESEAIRDKPKIPCISTLAHVGNQDYDVFLLPGDLSYADENQSRWDSFGRLVEEYASRCPWMVTEGNHELECFAFTAYNARWLMSYKESGSTSNLYYSFNVASSHILMLGSYTDFEKGSDQYKWVEADLGKVDRTATPWVFAVMHVPWYNTNEAHIGERESMREAMEDLLYKARVDVVFTGHVHAYERFTRIYNTKADPCGPVYITIGDGGNRQGLAYTFVDPLLSLYREPSFGHGRLRVVNESHAHWSWHHNNVSNSFVTDEVWLQSLTTTKSCWPSTLDKDESKNNNIDEL